MTRKIFKKLKSVKPVNLQPPANILKLLEVSFTVTINTDLKKLIFFW